MAKISVSLALVCISLYISVLVDACPKNLRHYPLLSQNCAAFAGLKCGPTGLVAVPGSCNLFITCNSPAMMITACAPGAVFDENLGLCNHASTANCNAGNPCKTRKNISNNKECYGYLECVNGHLLEAMCPPGHAFDENFGTCQPNNNCQAPVSNLQWVSTICDPILNEPNFFLEKTTMRNTTTNANIYTETKRHCTVGVYDKDCRCTPETVGCQNVKVLDLSSGKGTWSTHRVPSANNRYFIIRGTGEVSTFGTYPNWGYCDSQTSFESDAFRNNEAGNYWALKFLFQSLRNTNIPGLDQKPGPGRNQPLALVSNSNSNEGCDPTLGCQLNPNPAQVECFVKTRRRDGSENTYRQSVNVNPAMRITVELKRDGKRGYLTVTQNGHTVPSGQKTWKFNDDDAVIPTRCAGSICSGAKLRKFLGVFDYVMFEKQCP